MNSAHRVDHLSPRKAPPGPPPDASGLSAKLALPGALCGQGRWRGGAVLWQSWCVRFVGWGATITTTTTTTHPPTQAPTHTHKDPRLTQPG